MEMTQLEKTHTLSLVIPLFNEEKNIVGLVEMFEQSNLLNQGLLEVVLVDNGSHDKTKQLINTYAARHSWITPLYLQDNVNYGGGVLQGLQIAQADFIGYLPGDLQTTADDVLAVWRELVRLMSDNDKICVLVKGKRTVRKDGLSTRVASMVYTFLANRMLALAVADVNGLPKIFHRSLLKQFPANMLQTFVFDAQLLQCARQNQWLIKEVPVTFYARRQGVSTWSKKRLKIYQLVFRQLLQLRKKLNKI